MRFNTCKVGVPLSDFLKISKRFRIITLVIMENAWSFDVFTGSPPRLHVLAKVLTTLFAIFTVCNLLKSLHAQRKKGCEDYGFGNAVVLKGSHTKHLKTEECANLTQGSFRPQISFFLFRHFLTLLDLCWTVVVLHRDTICPLSDLCIPNLNIAYTFI